MSGSRNFQHSMWHRSTVIRESTDHSRNDNLTAVVHDSVMEIAKLIDGESITDSGPSER
jgi:hypothetical protein